MWRARYLPSLIALFNYCVHVVVGYNITSTILRIYMYVAVSSRRLLCLVTALDETLVYVQNEHRRSLLFECIVGVLVRNDPSITEMCISSISMFFS